MKVYCIYVATHYADDVLIHTVSTEAEAIRVVEAYKRINSLEVRVGAAFYSYRVLHVVDAVDTTDTMNGNFGLQEFN